MTRKGVEAVLISILYTSLISTNACTTTTPEVAPAPLLELMESQQTGIDFVNTIEENIENNVFTYTNYYNGGGVSTGDINNDGLVDIYLGANSHSGKLYLNQGGFKFEDITEISGLDSIPGWKTGVTMADINQDGYLDLYVCRSGRTRPRLRANLLYINNGDLTFTEAGESYGLNDWSTSLQAAFFDYDLDGDLDMFLLNHAIDPVREIFKNFNDDDINRYTGDKLYRNDKGKFTLIADDIGINRSKLGDGLGVSISDFNNDRYPDIYVANDFAGRDYLYLNQGTGRFRERALQSMGHISYSSMGTDAADIDNDGNMDLLVLDMRSSNNYGRKTNMASMNSDAFHLLVSLDGHHQYMLNTLQLNNGNETFSDIAPMAGVSSTDWSWAPLFVDLDNDGFKDLFVTNGMRKNSNNKDFIHYKDERIALESKKKDPDRESMIRDILDHIPSEKVVNLVFRNNGGLNFIKSNQSWGVLDPTYSNGAAYADLDNDGDLDLVINNIDQEAHIYRNNSNELNQNHFIRIKLNGPVQNRNGIGARVMIRTGEMSQYIEQQTTRGYQSSVDFILHFGTGQHRIIDEVKVTWPDGKENLMEQINTDQLLNIAYSMASFPPIDAGNDSISTRLFSNVTRDYKIGHRHQENDFDDFKREILLPHKMSTFGPALAVGDINHDGLEDFYIGGASGFPGEIFLQKDDRSFLPVDQTAIEADRDHEDVDALLFDADRDNDLDLYVVSGGNEMPEGDNYYQDRLYVNVNGVFHYAEEALPVMGSSGGVVRGHDFDSDGDQDLFVGGRLLPGQYPRPGRSYLLENVEGRFVDATDKWSQGLMHIGMVTDAAWSDHDQDGLTDLVLAGEWMPVTVFGNQGGILRKIENLPGLEQTNGWWFSLLRADVNQDGRDDYIAGNLGENYKYNASSEAPFQLYSSDFDNNGSLDIVLSYFENQILYPLRGKECSSQQVPNLKSKFKDYNSFGLATLEDVYGNSLLESSEVLTARNFKSGVFINNGRGFDFLAFPDLAQISAVFGIIHDDFNHDDIPDIVLAGNLYNSEVETPRNDSGHGLLLTCDHQGHFTPMRTYASGLFIPGDVKKLKQIQLGQGAETHKGILAGINNGNTILIVNH